MSKTSTNLPEGTPHFQTSVMLSRNHPQLYGLVARNAEDFISVTCRQRGPNDFTAVLKRYGSDGQAEVLFGNGPDFVSCLFSLEGSLAAGRWKVDVPYEERNKKK